MRLEKILSIFFCLSFFLNILPPHCFAQYLQIEQYLIDLGRQHYLRQEYSEALHLFQKILVINPDSQIAAEYINKISGCLESAEKIVLPQKPCPIKPQGRELSREDLISKAMDETSAIAPRAAGIPPKIISAPGDIKAPGPTVPGIIPKEAAVLPPRIIILDESAKGLLAQPTLELEIGRPVIIEGRQISRWLLTSPNIVSAERESSDRIRLTAKEPGVTYLHLWDGLGRWTFTVFGVHPRPEGPTLEEQLRLEEEKANSFKLEYGLDWNSFESGRRLDSLDRKSYQYIHNLRLDGQTPYGRFDSRLSVRKLTTTTDLTFVTLGLREGIWGNFRDFELKGLDFTPGFYNLAFTDFGLRGAMLKSPAFNKKIDYTLFWGREGGGAFGNLSPGLAQTRDSFLSGMDLNYAPYSGAKYGFSVIHGWGRQRSANLNPYNYDFDVDYKFGNTNLNYEISHDSETFGQILNLGYQKPGLRLGTRIRNIDENFISANAIGAERGILGGLFFGDYTPFENWNISSRLDVFKDRVFPAADNRNRWNQDYDLESLYTINRTTSLRAFYRLQNELGRLSQFRGLSSGLTLSRSFEQMRRLSTYLGYQHQESKFFTSPANDYINEKVTGGLRFRLFGGIYYYINKEFNWLRERSFATEVSPEVLEQGLDWYGRLSKNVTGNLRLIYRDEENTVSNLGFLSGEDYLEGYSEITYAPNPETEFYLSARSRNIWADNPLVTKRIDLDLRIGMRYNWDTGLRWESVGNIDGYVFKDYDINGIKKSDEPGVSGVKLWLGKDRSETTNSDGYYRFRKVKAKKAYVTMDTVSIPSGFTLTAPHSQAAEITHGRSARLDFGIISQTEIAGIVFYDKDGDGQFTSGDSGIRAVLLNSEDGTRVATDNFGKFFFRKLSPGVHTLTLDLNSLPVEYIPQVPLTKEITISEGMRFSYNFPLRKSK